MGWKGIAFGAWIGSFFGGPLGALLGAALGHQVEKHIGNFTEDTPRQRTSGPGRPPRGAYAYRYSNVSAQKRAMIFCASAAAMLAKLAKADGHVTSSEISSVEAAFSRLGFDADARAYAVNVFRRAKDDSHTIFEYAAEFSAAVDSVEVRELFYELLWDLACSDGNVSYNELSILRRIPFTLGIRADWFDIFFRERLGASSHGGRSRARAPEPPRDALAEAYAVLGVSPSASDADVKKAYRELAKKNHPDLLRAQGLPEEMIGKATEKMGRINEAWSVVRERRGI